MILLLYNTLEIFAQVFQNLTKFTDYFGGGGGKVWH